MDRDGQDRNTTAQSQRHGESRLRAALDIAALGSWEYDPSTDLTRGDSRFADIYGWLPGEALTSEQVYEVIHPDDRSQVRQRVETALQSGEPYRAEYRILRRDGAQRWVLVHGRPLGSGEAGTGTGRFIGAVMDLTEQREQEAQKLAALEGELQTAALLDSLLEAAPIGIAFWDRELRFHRLNERLAQMNGLPMEAHIGRRPDEILPGVRGLDEVLRQCRTVLETGEPLLDVEIQGRTQGEPAGERVWLEDFFPIRLGEDIVGLGAVVEDITERRQAEAALRHSESRYRKLFDSIDDGFCIIEAILDDQGRGIDHRFLEINPAFERHTGLLDARGRTAREMIPDLEGRWPENYGRVAVSRMPERFVDSSEAMGRWFDVYAFPIDEPQERRVALLFRDVTRTKQLEELQREEARRKDRFLATLAHELRNPLAPLRSGLDLLSLAGADSAARQRVLPLMQRQMMHLVRLVDDLLDLSRITSGKVRLDPEICDLRSILSQAVEASAEDAFEDRHVVLDVPDQPVRIRCDRVRLIQVFGNLLSNARKFTAEDGRIAIRVQRQDGQVRVAIQDDGAGIPHEDLERIFDLFDQGETDSHVGLGIGLTLVRDLVQLHEGTVRAFSEGIGHGSEFVVVLPLADGHEPQGGAHTDDAESTSVTRSERVLVVDDNQDAAESLSMLLTVMGATVETALDGRSALREAARFKPHMVLLDIGMPDMNGYEVAAAMRSEMGEETPLLVAVTGWGNETDKARARAAGFDDHLTKPVEAKALHGLLALLDATSGSGR